MAGHSALDDVVSVVAELVANAVRHTRSGLPGGVLVVEVRRWRGGVAVAVSDQGGLSEPCVGEAGEMAESGRGLCAVQALASRWGWAGDAGGRTVIGIFEES